MAAFSREALRFLANLEKNNEREWFQPRKEQYEELVRDPMLGIVEFVNRDLEVHAPNYVTDPGKSVYRIYRDTRFSPDKTPYKTHIGALFWHTKLGKGGGAALYFHVSTKEVLIAGGLYHAAAEVLTLVRYHIAEHHERLRDILKRKKLEGDSLSRPPKGWPADHPAIELIKRKDLLLETVLASDTALKPGFGNELTRRFRTMLPLVEFLNEPLLKQQAKRKDPLLVN
jgi:uncharacterized protein (TIGR02453 family)